MKNQINKLGQSSVTRLSYFEKFSESNFLIKSKKSKPKHEPTFRALLSKVFKLVACLDALMLWISLKLIKISVRVFI